MSNVINFEDLMKGGGSGSAGRMDSKEIKKVIRDATQRRIARAEATEAALNEAVKCACAFFSQAVGTKRSELRPGQDFAAFAEESPELFESMSNYPAFVFTADGPDGEKYDFGLMFARNDPESGETETAMLLRRRKNGYFEVYDCADDEWGLEFTPKSGFLPDDVMREIDSRTQTGRFALECLIGSEIADADPAKIDFARITEKNKGLVRLLEAFPSDLITMMTLGLRPLVRIPDAPEEWGIGWENGEYVLFQYLDPDAVRGICEGSGADDEEDEDEYDEGYDDYSFEVGRTSDFDKVLAFVEERLKQSKEGVSFPTLTIPLSWERTYALTLGPEVLEAVKRDLVQGGFEKNEKEALRRFRNEFKEELGDFS